MIISPNSTIKLLSNVPLKNDLKHTLRFGGIGDQASYFNSKAAYTLSEQSYQRSYSGKMRIEKNCDDLYNVNYLMFQNTAFGSKWFYAFITNVEYINNVTSEITYEIDPLQTFMFEMQLNPCFVEREHAEFDDIGENILPEPVDLGEYNFNNRLELAALNDSAVVAVTTVSEESEKGGIFDNVPCGLDFWAFPQDSPFLPVFLRTFGQNASDIVALYVVPAFLLGGISQIPATGLKIPSGKVANSLNYYISKPTGNESFGSYTNIKNKKLFTYPYNYLMISNFSGQSLNLRYEFFGSNGGINISGTFLPPCQIVLRPRNYKGDNQGVDNAQEQITLEGYPQVAWINDTYKQWLAQNSVPMALNSLSTAAQAAFMGNFKNRIATAETLLNPIQSVTNNLTNSYVASIGSDHCRGNINSGNVNVTKKKQIFVVQDAKITSGYARAIDGFFSMFGYTQNRVKTPNINARPEFTFTKTAGSNVTGNIPANYLDRINKAFDDGITFWNNPANIYNYNIPNPPYDY